MPVLMRENTMIGNLAIKPGERESVSVTGDGTKTIQDLLYELAQKIDAEKVDGDSYISLKITNETQGISFTDEIVYNISAIIHASYSGQNVLNIMAMSYELGNSTETPSVTISEITLSSADKDENNYKKNKTFCVSGSQTPTMTLSYSNTDTMPASAELKFYY